MWKYSNCTVWQQSRYQRQESQGEKYSVPPKEESSGKLDNQLCHLFKWLKSRKAKKLIKLLVVLVDSAKHIG